MDNPEKLATWGTQDEDKQNKKHNTLCVGHHYLQANTNNANKTRVLLQTTGGNDELNIVLCGNRNEHHNTELRRSRHIIGQHNVVWCYQNKIGIYIICICIHLILMNKILFYFRIFRFQCNIRNNKNSVSYNTVSS
jgi:hypothetical protein